ncbi:MAG TPA: FAD-binding oxidoreductase, partial [Flavobacteriaceae bacterium]|nr:FAD-binding oxidoreductase [Flavobacteriaceae bacterium]
MADFYKLKVKDLQEETNDCMSLELEVPKKLRREFRYGAGQHIIFRKDHNGEEIRRTYSLCSDPFS